MPLPQDKNAKLFATFISSKKVLVADKSSGARTGLAKTMIDLGANPGNVVLADSYEIAESEIERVKPHIVICDYDLGMGRCGLDLLQKQRKENPDSKNSLFILVTGNTSQSAVAQAAEEDIDLFVLKPYTIETLRNTVMKAALQKIYPSDYMKTIDAGKKLLLEGKADEAMEIFKKAKSLDPKPALACFYHGQAELMKEAMDAAAGDYNNGLKYNKIHYKCLIGLYDVLMSKKLHADAYEVVKKVARYFPANPQRLSQVLRLAIMTQSYEDIEKYYQTFTQIETRDEMLIKFVCAALVVTGKFYLQRNFGSRALELFNKAATTGAGRTKILREIITALVQHNLAKEASEFLKRFPPKTQSEADFLTMDLIVGDKLHPPSMTIDKGRKLIQNGIHDPEIYKVLITRCIEVGFKDNAEKLLQDAVKKWPDLQTTFESLLKNTKGQDKSA